MQKCPNCAGVLVLSNDKKKKVCPYCEAEFYISDKENEIASKIQPKNQISEKERTEKNPARMFAFRWWNLANIQSKPNCSRCVTALTGIMSECVTSTMIYSRIKPLLSGSNFAMKGYNDALLENVGKQYSKLLNAQEELMLYYDTGLLSFGKSGLLITNSRIFLKSTTNTVYLFHKNIVSMVMSTLLDFPTWKINNQSDVIIKIKGASYELVGYIIALICMLSWENNDKDHTITLSMDV